MTPARLLEHLHLRQPGAVFLDDPEALTAGLRWLALKGFAIRQEGPAWTVSGLAKKRFLDVFIAGWPDQARKEWEQLRHPAPQASTTDASTPECPHDMQRRLELILDVNDVTITEYRTGNNDAGHWDLRRHQPDGLFLDGALYDSGHRLGVEPVSLPPLSCTRRSARQMARLVAARTQQPARTDQVHGHPCARGSLFSTSVAAERGASLWK